MTKLATDVFTTDGVEIIDGDEIEIILPGKSIYSGMTLAKGKVFFRHGSYRVPHYDKPSTSSRLDDFSHDCIINKLEESNND